MIVSFSVSMCSQRTNGFHFSRRVSAPFQEAAALRSNEAPRSGPQVVELGNRGRVVLTEDIGETIEVRPSNFIPSLVLARRLGRCVEIVDKILCVRPKVLALRSSILIGLLVANGEPRAVVVEPPDALGMLVAESDEIWVARVQVSDRGTREQTGKQRTAERLAESRADHPNNPPLVRHAPSQPPV